MEDAEGKLNAIVGSAIRANVESGASDEAVAAFAYKHRSKVAQLLGIEKAPPVEVDLQAVISAAVTTALQQTGLIGRGAITTSDRVNVLVSGRRTSLTIDSHLLKRLTESTGKQEAGNVIQNFANQAPEGTKNRSKWVQDQLLAYVAMQGVNVNSLIRH